MITGFVSGLLLSLLFSIPAVVFPQIEQPGQRTYQWAAILLTFGVNFFSHFSNAAILEEPIYRGFLWGYFRSMGWKNQSILLMTTGIFWLSHINYLDNPLMFWVITLFAGLSFGLLTWWSGSITPAIFAHATVNSMRGLAGEVIRRVVDF